MGANQCCGSVNISFGSVSADPGCRLITGQAGSGSYMDIFVAFENSKIYVVKYQ
jgi:hypothetical protein